MPEKNNKKNFFKDLIKSVKDLDKYEDFAIEKPSTAIKYFIKLIAIFCIVISLFYTLKTVSNIQDIYTNLQNKLPEYTYLQGILDVNSEEPIIIEDYNDTFGKIIIDTQTNEEQIKEYETLIKDIGTGVIILNDRCIVITNGTMGKVTYNYSDLAGRYDVNEFSKQSITNYINSKNMISIYISVYLILFIYLFILYFISIFIDVLILSLLAFIVSRFSRIKLKYAPSLNIAIHSITLPLILNLIYIIVNLSTGFNIKYFGLMYNAISYIYVIVAILMIKTDFINRQMELIKLAKEQEKVKEEMKKQEEEKQENKEEHKSKDNKEPKEQEQNKKEKGKKKDSSDEPVGDASIVPEER